LNVFQPAIFPKNQPFSEVLRGFDREIAETSMSFRQLASKTWRKPPKTLQKPKKQPNRWRIGANPAYFDGSE